MANTPNSTSSGRLGTKSRNKLVVSHSIMNAAQSKIYYAYSPKSDQDYVLRGDLQWAHFLYVESDVSIAHADYKPCTHTIIVATAPFKTNFDALVTLRNGRTEYREVRSSMSLQKLSNAARQEWREKVEAAERADVNYRRYTELEILDRPQKIANWMRIIAWLAATRGRSLHAETLALGSIIHARGGVTFAEIRALGEGASQATYIAAAFRGIQNGIFKADLEYSALTANTLVEEGSQHES